MSPDIDISGSKATRREDRAEISKDAGEAYGWYLGQQTLLIQEAKLPTDIKKYITRVLRERRESRAGLSELKRTII
jgi:hypothetical protein